jgi:hypothetical protein
MLVSRFLAQIVYQATARGPLVLAGVVATMALIGLVELAHSTAFSSQKQRVPWGRASMQCV